MEKGNGERKQAETGLGEHEYGYWSGAPMLFDRRENPREVEEIPGLDICCAYADTEICGRCGAC